MVWILVAIAVVVVLLMWVVGLYNRLVSLRNRFKNAFAQIDVQLKRRYDLIPNLVETAKGYLKHERETLEAVITARNAAVTGLKNAARNPTDPNAVQQLSGAENALSGALGRLFALASIPFMLALYFLMRLPRFPGVLVGIQNPWCWQYRLTNRRLIMENPFGRELKSVALDRFDAIDVVVEPGQAWYKAGDLVFRQGAVETFRIWAVPRPETFRQTCLKSQMSFVGVQKAREAGVAV